MIENQITEQYSQLLAETERDITVRHLSEEVETAVVRNGAQLLQTAVHDGSVAVTQTENGRSRVTVMPSSIPAAELLKHALGDLVSPTTIRTESRLPFVHDATNSDERLRRKVARLTESPTGQHDREIRTEVVRRRVGVVRRGVSAEESYTATTYEFRSTLALESTNHFSISGAQRNIASALDELTEYAIPRASRFHGIPRASRLCADKDALVFIPREIAAQLVALISKSFSAEAVVEQRSRLANRINSRIASVGVSIVDDPFHALAPRTVRVDDEGVSTRRKELVRNGVLLDFLGSTSASTQAIASAGNAWQPDMTSAPRVTGSNFFVQAGSEPIDIQPGTIEVLQSHGLHMANEITGAFSMSTSAVVESAHGESLTTGVTIAGNVFEMLNEIVAVGSSLHWIAGSVAYYGSPDLLVRGLSIGKVQ